jgi:hypothetical protein
LNTSNNIKQLTLSDLFIHEHVQFAAEGVHVSVVLRVTIDEELKGFGRHVLALRRFVGVALVTFHGQSCQ